MSISDAGYDDNIRVRCPTTGYSYDSPLYFSRRQGCDGDIMDEAAVRALHGITGKNIGANQHVF